MPHILHGGDSGGPKSSRPVREIDLFFNCGKLGGRTVERWLGQADDPPILLARESAAHNPHEPRTDWQHKSRQALTDAIP